MCKSKHLHEHLPHLRRRRPRGLWELRGAAETKQEIADARVEQLSLENLRAGLWHMPYISCVFQCMQNYRLFRNYCWRHSFLPPNRFCMFHHFSHVAYVCRFWNGEKSNETAKKPDETAKQIKNPKCGNWNGEKNCKQRKFRQPAIIIAGLDFER